MKKLKRCSTSCKIRYATCINHSRNSLANTFLKQPLRARKAIFSCIFLPVPCSPNKPFSYFPFLLTQSFFPWVFPVAATLYVCLEFFSWQHFCSPDHTVITVSVCHLCTLIFPVLSLQPQGCGRKLPARGGRIPFFLTDERKETRKNNAKIFPQI